jgi:ABC-type tungstate transport system substrate-binding protein
MINDGIPSKPTHLEGFRRFIALLTSAGEIGAVGKKSVMTGCEAVMVGQDVLKIIIIIIITATNLQKSLQSDMKQIKTTIARKLKERWEEKRLHGVSTEPG